MGNSIAYKSGYKYQLAFAYLVDIELTPEYYVESEYLHLSAGGVLTVQRGYAWDGPSGPTIDTKNFMRGSLVHDALYQLIREGKLDQNTRLFADKLLRKMCKQDGMSSIRAWWVYKGVRFAGWLSTKPNSRKRIKIAP